MREGRVVELKESHIRAIVRLMAEAYSVGLLTDDHVALAEEIEMALPGLIDEESSWLWEHMRTYRNPQA
jgi:hypothetical protein